MDPWSRVERTGRTGQGELENLEKLREGCLAWDPGIVLNKTSGLQCAKPILGLRMSFKSEPFGTDCCWPIFAFVHILGAGTAFQAAVAFPGTIFHPPYPSQNVSKQH